MNPRPLVTVWTEERAEGSFVILRTDRGALMLQRPCPDGALTIMARGEKKDEATQVSATTA